MNVVINKTKWYIIFLNSIYIPFCSNLFLNQVLDMSNTNKRDRGANYTNEEKLLLVDLVTQQKHIIENKRTGGTFIQQKRAAWAVITQRYNSCCTSGPRGTEQLKALYDNMKQKTRKAVGETNKHHYIQKFFENQDDEQIKVMQEDLSNALNNLKDDKIQLHKTGGGCWRPKVTDCDAKLLAVIQDQVEPLCNPYDSGATYFKDTFQNTNPPPPPVLIEIADNGIRPSTSTDIQVTLAPVQYTAPPYKHKEKLIHKRILENSTQNKIKKVSSTESLKKLYFKKKIQNADLERKKFLLEILKTRRELSEHTLKMKILQKQLDNL